MSTTAYAAINRHNHQDPTRTLQHLLACAPGQEENAYLATCPASEATPEIRLRAAIDSGILEKELEMWLGECPPGDCWPPGRASGEWTPIGPLAGSYHVTVECSLDHARQELMDAFRRAADSGRVLDYHHDAYELGAVVWHPPVFLPLEMPDDDDDDI